MEIKLNAALPALRAAAGLPAGEEAVKEESSLDVDGMAPPTLLQRNIIISDNVEPSEPAFLEQSE